MSFKPVSKTYVVPLDKQDAAIAELKAESGIALIKPTGLASIHGVKVQYVISGTNVTVTLVDKPFFVTEGEVFGLLDKHLS